MRARARTRHVSFVTRPVALSFARASPLAVDRKLFMPGSVVCVPYAGVSAMPKTEGHLVSYERVIGLTAQKYERYLGRREKKKRADPCGPREAAPISLSFRSLYKTLSLQIVNR